MEKMRASLRATFPNQIQLLGDEINDGDASLGDL